MGCMRSALGGPTESARFSFAGAATRTAEGIGREEEMRRRGEEETEGREE
jgi:hypothetical protein